MRSNPTIPKLGSVWDSGRDFIVVTDVRKVSAGGREYVRVTGDVINDLYRDQGTFMGVCAFNERFPSLFLQHVSENSNWGAYYAGRIPVDPQLM